MTKRKRAKAVYAWAAAGKRSGRVLRNLDGHYSIWDREISALDDCQTYGRVARVRMTEIKQ